LPDDVAKVFVMPGLEPGIHAVFLARKARKAWMAGTSPAMTRQTSAVLRLRTPA
jgi:hypothetical protein